MNEITKLYIAVGAIFTAASIIAFSFLILFL